MKKEKRFIVNPKHLLAVMLLVGLDGVALASESMPQQVVATAQTLKAVGGNKSVDVQFNIAVKNAESSTASAVWVVFADGQRMYVGDVAAQGSAVSAPGSRNIDLSKTPTRNQPVPVKLQFIRDGVNVEQAQNLVLQLPIPAPVPAP